MVKIKSVETIKDIYPLKQGIKVEFEKPLCFIVGDNGVGKSTLLDCISSYFKVKDDSYLKRRNMAENIVLDKQEEPFSFRYADFHADDKKYAGSFGSNIGLHLTQMKASSGQVSISLLNNLLGDIEKVRNGCVILDEPERGQSIRNQLRLTTLISALINKLNCQVIITCHSQIILEAFKDKAQYFDIEENKTTSYVDYYLKQII